MTKESLIWTIKGREVDLTDRGLVMGILNVTPDSFSDGGAFVQVDRALQQARRMIEEGAGIIDVGGESTRPGAEPVTEEEELRRTVPVIKAIRSGWGGIISIDTAKAAVAEKSLEAGADVVNDVTGLGGDPRMMDVCREAGCGVVVMHMQGEPRTMQKDPRYVDVVSDVRSYFAERFAAACQAGIRADALCFDPGIGFGKTLEHNLALVAHLDRLVVQGRPLLLGVSRKSFVGKVLGDPEMDKREWPTVALTAYARDRGVRIHRVHSVRENLEALRMTEAVIKAL